ncbi:hypothetical protein Fcan01_20982 [Folsomia candida]|uniref:Uncharacterized protein n=1 Tax=Folsomia candida TaxID=158441 RepID=A0A226DH76_FOLCA|nr:hypothetical protein Fcan01_20982 [Folsomia candida]
MIFHPDQLPEETNAYFKEYPTLFILLQFCAVFMTSVSTILSAILFQGYRTRNVRLCLPWLYWTYFFIGLMAIIMAVLACLLAFYAIFAAALLCVLIIGSVLGVVLYFVLVDSFPNFGSHPYPFSPRKPAATVTTTHQKDEIIAPRKVSRAINHPSTESGPNFLRSLNGGGYKNFLCGPQALLSCDNDCKNNHGTAGGICSFSENDDNCYCGDLTTLVENISLHCIANVGNITRICDTDCKCNHAAKGGHCDWSRKACICEFQGS